MAGTRGARHPDLTDLVWPVLHWFMDGHVMVYRATHGLVGHHVPGAPPSLLLDHVGARSGKQRTTALAYVSDGDDVAIIASKGGHARHPGWYHNLRAHPDTTVQIGSRRLAVHARAADGEERERLWRKAVKAWPAYDDYQRRTARRIPVVVLERR